jgi:hypothetical protein
MATILELEVFVDPKHDSLVGEAYLTGDQRGLVDAFRAGDRVKAVAEVVGGLTGQETALRFNWQPAAEGLARLDDIVWFHPPTPRVTEKWVAQRPAIVDRITRAQSAQTR